MKHTDTKGLVKKYGKHDKDTGGYSVQIAIMTERIETLASHLKLHPKDHHSRRGLLGLVRDRSGLLRKFAQMEKEECAELVDKLGIRKKRSAAKKVEEAKAEEKKAEEEKAGKKKAA